METKQYHTCPTPNGTLLIIGGHENKDGSVEKKVQQGDSDHLEVLKAFIKLTGKDDPAIEVITTASSEGKESFEDYEKAFTNLGVSKVGHIHHDKRKEILSDDLLSKIDQADAVFFSGGDQLKLTSIYGGSAFLLRLKQRYIYESLVLAGTSAGAMAMSTPMIYAGNKAVQQITGEVKITTGLEFLKDVCIDTHFVDRGRMVRMAQVIATNPTCIGLGIEEDTALIIKNGTEAEVIGSGVVVVVDGFNITDSNICDIGTNHKISIDDLNVKLLSNGSCYNIPQINPRHI